MKVTEGDRTRVQAYEGVCIARNGGGLNESFTVRKISYGEGVERVFPIYSPMIDSIKLVRRGKVRRAKLYYLRDRRGKSARIVERVDNSPAKGKAKGSGGEMRFGRPTGGRLLWRSTRWRSRTSRRRRPTAPTVEAGKTYWWCACGKSEQAAVLRRLAQGQRVHAHKSYTAEKDGTAWFCGCKHTKNAPLCDGTHKTL